MKGVDSVTETLLALVPQSTQYEVHIILAIRPRRLYSVFPASPSNVTPMQPQIQALQHAPSAEVAVPFLFPIPFSWSNCIFISAATEYVLEYSIASLLFS